MISNTDELYFLNLYFIFHELYLPSLFTCVCPLVDLEVFTPGEHLAAAWEGARERLLPGVDPDVIDQLVLGFERFIFPGTTLPQTGMVGLFRSPNVLHCDVGDDLVHCREGLVARFLGLWLVGFDPHTRMFLLDRRPHVPEEGAGPVRSHVVELVYGVHVGGHVHVEGVVSREVFPTGASHLGGVLVGPAVHVGRGSREAKPHLGVDVGVGGRRRGLVEAGEENVTGDRVCGVHAVETGSRRGEHAVGRPRGRVCQAHVVPP